jgi:hypothetical protein
MGNSISNETQPKNIKSLSQTIDDIAIHYILKQNVIDLLRLTDKEYYDNLIVLIGKVFDSRLTNLEIGVLSGRINETIQDAVFSLLPATDNIKNKMISNISKFYMKIMMIYSAIVATIDPQYSYEDEQGQKQFFYLKDLSVLKKLPKESNPVLHQLTNPMNLCRKRITILKNKLETDDDFIILNPGDKLCSIDSATNLTDEVGIKELDLLYYDIFDYSNKSWKKRSKEMEEKYKKDLVLFYQIFTGKEDMPSEIKSFKDIELIDFKNLEYCNDPLFKQDFTVSKNDKLVMDYIKQINIIEEEVKVYRIKLTDILKGIFLIKVVDDEQTYGINPTLTMPQILKLEEETRNTIINLYTNCERNFIKALLIFEEIYDIKSQDSQQYRYNNIEQGAVTSALPTNSFSNFDKTPAPPSYNKEPLFKNTMNITSSPNESFKPSEQTINQSFESSGLPESPPMSQNTVSSDSIPLSQNTIVPETKPIESQPPESQPPESQPPESQSPETKPLESNPLESQPPESQSPETKPLESNPLESKPLESKPLNSQNPETKPLNSQNPETKPLNSQNPETKPLEPVKEPAKTPNFWEKLTNFSLTPKPVTEAGTEPVKEPIKEPGTESVKEAVAEPVKEPVKEPIKEPGTEPKEPVKPSETTINETPKV